MQGYALVPFRSLAVDSRFSPIGHVVELPELRGMPLPDGTPRTLYYSKASMTDAGGAVTGART